MEETFYDVGTWICSGPVNACKEFIKFNGFTKEDVRLIMDKENEITGVVSKKAGLCGGPGFIPSPESMNQ